MASVTLPSCILGCRVAVGGTDTYCGEGGGEVGVLTVPLLWRGVEILAVLSSVGEGG